MDIITDIDILRAPNEETTIKEGLKIVKKLNSVLSKNIGVGLAAPQIGINKRVCIIRAEQKINLINPKILKQQGYFVFKNEGCLSLPNLMINTIRSKKVFIIDDLNGELCLTGFSAIIAQHEIDHLNSILMIDRATSLGKIPRNGPCPCGAKKDGKFIKFKNCHFKEEE